MRAVHLDSGEVTPLLQGGDIRFREFGELVGIGRTVLVRVQARHGKGGVGRIKRPSVAKTDELAFGIKHDLTLRHDPHMRVRHDWRTPAHDQPEDTQESG